MTSQQKHLAEFIEITSDQRQRKSKCYASLILISSDRFSRWQTVSSPNLEALLLNEYLALLKKVSPEVLNFYANNEYLIEEPKNEGAFWGEIFGWPTYECKGKTFCHQ